MREAAEAMGCTFVYAIVPTKPLGELRRTRAIALADARERLIAAFLDGSPLRLWNES